MRLGERHQHSSPPNTTDTSEQRDTSRRGEESGGASPCSSPCRRCPGGWRCSGRWSRSRQCGCGTQTGVEVEGGGWWGGGAEPPQPRAPILRGGPEGPGCLSRAVPAVGAVLPSPGCHSPTSPNHCTATAPVGARGRPPPVLPSSGQSVPPVISQDLGSCHTGICKALAPTTPCPGVCLGFGVGASFPALSPPPQEGEFRQSRAGSSRARYLL